MNGIDNNTVFRFPSKLGLQKVVDFINENKITVEIGGVYDLLFRQEAEAAFFAMENEHNIVQRLDPSVKAEVIDELEQLLGSNSAYHWIAINDNEVRQALLDILASKFQIDNL